MKNLLIITLLLTSLITFTQTLSLDTGETYAVVVGISDYQDEGIPDLRFADKDALAFAGFLQSPAGGELDEDHLKVLVNNQATAGQVISSLYWLLEASKEGDRVIIYFSGHGDVENIIMGNPGHLLCWDAPSRVYMAGGTLQLFNLQSVISTLSIQKKVKVYVITDACRSGKLSGSGVGGPKATTANLSQQYANEIKILSCQPDEYSIEGEQWGGGRGAFSYHLLDGLYGLADGNGDLNVSLKEIGRYLEDNVAEQVAPEKQNPLIIGDRTIKLTDVFPDILEEIKEGRRGQMQLFKPTETRGMEADVLASIDSTTQEIYAAFKRALKEKQFLEPVDACADAYYEILIKELKLERLHSSMRRNYAAALQDDAQQFINKILKTDPSGVLVNLYTISEEKVHLYPSYLGRAAELLSADHYMYDFLKARQNYFEAYLLAQNNSNRTQESGRKVIAKFREALAWKSDLAYIYSGMSKTFAFYQLEPDSSEYYVEKASETTGKWILPYLELASISMNFDHDLPKAKSLLDRAMEIDSSSPLLRYYLGTYYNKLGQLLQAEKEMKKAVALDSSNTIRHSSGLGYLYTQMGKYDLAEAYFQEALQLDSNSFPININLCFLYITTEQFQKAVTACSRCLDIRNDIPDIKCYLATALSGLGQDKEAERQHLEAIHMDTTNYVSYFEYGTFLLRNERYWKAVEQLEIALRLNPNDYYSMRSLGHGYFKTGKYEEAEKLLQKILLENQNSPYFFREVGWVYMLSDRSYKAESLLLRALELDSTTLYAHSILGLVYAKTDQYEKAEKMLEKALLLNATNRKYVYINYAILYAEKGSLEQAFTYLENALKDGYNPRTTKYLRIEQEPSLERLRVQKERWDALIQKYFPDENKK